MATVEGDPKAPRVAVGALRAPRLLAVLYLCFMPPPHPLPSPSRGGGWGTAVGSGAAGPGCGGRCGAVGESPRATPSAPLSCPPPTFPREHPNPALTLLPPHFLPHNPPSPPVMLRGGGHEWEPRGSRPGPVPPPHPQGPGAAPGSSRPPQGPTFAPRPRSAACGKRGVVVLQGCDPPVPTPREPLSYRDPLFPSHRNGFAHPIRAPVPTP